MGGNIGTPLITYVHDGVKADFVVVELSSFQLETIQTLKPRIAILLNITEDHLDRYPSFALYRDAKFRIFMNQTEEDFALINFDDETTKPIIPSLSAQVMPFSSQTVLPQGMYAHGATLCYRNKMGATHVYSLANNKLMGAHNRENMLAAIGAAELCGCAQANIQEGLDNFCGLEHRLEYVEEIDGVFFYNDSKATNIDALLRSLQSFPGNIILIAGGREKGGDYRVLKNEIQSKVRMLILIGESREKLFQLFGACSPTRFAHDLEEAVRLAFQPANQGDVVLLAPGCASFDMFSSYAERGQKFKQAVQRLAYEHKKQN
jgi:UDP-N-acetylmuramoylalanine--D-glutamate ligase